MTKALFLLLFLTFFALTALWFVENDGSVVVEWLGYRIQTSVAFAILFMIIAIVSCTLFLQTILWLKSAPKRYKKAWRDRKLNRGLTALTQGFAAIYLGDTKQAKLLSSRASSNLDNMPLTKLLAAQTAQLDGNRLLAQEHYSSMLQDKDTEIIAIKGLLLEAKQDSDLGKALFLAEKAYKINPNADWVIRILLDLYRKLKKWPQAIDVNYKALERNLITKQDANRNKGLIAFAKYQELQRVDNNIGYDLINTAYKSVPDLAPIIAAYASSLLQRGKKRKATKILQNAMRRTQHPDLFAIYMEIFADATPEKLTEKSEQVLELCNGHPEAHILVASNAVDAGQLDKARKHLKIALSYGETTKACLLMAELETFAHAEHKIVHYWRDLAGSSIISIWKCLICLNKTHKYNVNCKNCNSFDSLEWQDVLKGTSVVVPKLVGSGDWGLGIRD